MDFSTFMMARELRSQKKISTPVKRIIKAMYHPQPSATNKNNPNTFTREDIPNMSQRSTGSYILSSVLLTTGN
jgi:hypothetical protein